MDSLNRRDAVKAAVAVGVAALGGAALAADDKAEDKVASSGETANEAKTNVTQVDLAKVKIRPQAAGSLLNTFFSRTTPDSSPGRNILTISGLPAGTRVISVWMTEWSQDGQPHAGGAFFYTTSVQLYNNGQQCRVVYNQDWNTNLPAGCQVIYGPG